MAFHAVHTLVSRAAERHPQRTAVEDPRGALSYAALEALSDHVATKLTAAGATAGDFVLVLAEDRREVIAAVLGVLKIGGVFVPLDVTGPRDQVANVLTDTAARYAVVGSGRWNRALPVTTVVVDASRPVAPTTSAAPSHRPAPDDPCYLFYTSGSTGRPKGILGRLCGIDHYVRWEADFLGVTGEWRVSQLTTPAFDAMLRDFFVPLTAGGTVCVPPAGAVLDPSTLLTWLDERQITLLHCVPSVFHTLVDAASRGDAELAALRFVATAGEKLPTADVKRWFERYGQRIGLLNLYGPSETTMTKTYHRVTASDVDLPSIPIGTPMPGAEVLVLDERQRPCPPGDLGEIYIRTPYRSLGHHNRAEATRAAFVPNPLTGDADDLVYRTGDLARQLPGGALEYIGRSDHQVKIAGVRVELGGVESVLETHPAVAKAAVAAFAGPEDVPYLCAFVELSGRADDGDLRDHLRATLPEAMVPAVFVRLKELPRTISGKIDRRALPEPVPAGYSEQDASPPRTSTEEALVRLWTRMLPVGHVGVRQEFFDVGGRSLQVMRMLTQVREEFGVEVPLADFLAAPTVESLARRLDQETQVRATPLGEPGHGPW
jgi:amino acid adenylation domain-containing protein